MALHQLRLLHAVSVLLLVVVAPPLLALLPPWSCSAALPIPFVAPQVVVPSAQVAEFREQSRGGIVYPYKQHPPSVDQPFLKPRLGKERVPARAVTWTHNFLCVVLPPRAGLLAIGQLYALVTIHNDNIS